MSLPPFDTALEITSCELTGVSCHHLTGDFLDWIRSKGQEVSSARVYDIEPAIRERGRDVMCPKTGKLGSSYVHAVQGEDHVGVANFMLSYSWRYLVDDIITSLVHHCDTKERNKMRTFFWICCLCINQHRVKEAEALGLTIPFEDFRQEFEQRVRGIGHVLALMTPWDEPVYVTRVWCVFEVFTAVNDPNCELTVILPPEEMKTFCDSIATGSLDRYLWSSLEQLDVETAEASVAADKEQILQIVSNGVGCAYLNQVVRHQLLQWLAESATHEALQQMSRGDLRGDVAAGIGSQISSFLHRLGLYERAAKLLQAAQLAATHDSEEKANLLRVVGQNLEYLNRGQEAAEIYMQACNVLERIGKLESHDGACVLTSWALQLQSADQTEKALEQFRKAWRIRGLCKAQDCLDGADLLSMMGVAECKLGQFEDGIRHASEGCELRKRLDQWTTPYGATIEQNLGICYFMAGDFQRALEYCEESRVVLERTGMLKSAQGANLAKRTAQVHCKLGDAAKELDLLHEARDIMEACGQLRSPEGAAVLLDLGSALLDARQDEKARKVLELADEICLEHHMEDTVTGQTVKKRLAILRGSCCNVS